MPRQTTHMKEADVKPNWHVVNAEGMILGRLATEVALVLMGKHRPQYTPNVMSGDCVIITNAEKIKVTGNKLAAKTLRRWSGYPGGLRVRTYESIMASKPELVVEEAVIRMLPRGRLGRRIRRNLRVLKGNTHDHSAQQPATLDFPNARR
ncbi:MAG: 50S ribosomal protein L13 [Planctomycetota bacterium]|jgi:large subunit ribosomal protein L13|nr:50S ribosomal protein L13 [Planctomycetota bacterium]